MNIRIGTRGSPLARWQAEHIAGRLAASGRVGEIGVQVIATSGDRIQDRALQEFGGKGLFTREIDEALLQRRVDLAVHSMKDLPAALPAGLVIAAVPERGDVRDAFVSHKAYAIADLPQGAVLGTASLRRQAQVRRLRPDLKVETFRGNVETRLRKLEQGLADATLLAYAGLERLKLERHAASVMSTDEMLPAVGQGALAVMCREDDETMREIVSPLHDPVTAVCIACERAFLAGLDGSCRTPIAGLAEISDRGLAFRGMLLKPDGSEYYEAVRLGAAPEAEALGADAAAELLDRAGPGFLAGLR
jgi:hydroxymethylbilane synthase